ncbi:hypothetical protein [Sorangium sp. So ce861]|uniref:hypothetical protein n=1 Tax=Sorangium sp. So ce861 TaxID=3133323 RepID=UPI003F613A59
MIADPSTGRGGLVSNVAEIIVTGTSLVSPVGLSAARSLAAIRAGITRIVEHPHHRPRKSPGEAGDAEGERGTQVAAVLDIEEDVSGPERLLRLALLALQGLFRDGVCERRDLPRCALLAAVPAPDPVVASWGLGHCFVPDLARRGGVDRWAGAEVVETGAPGSIHMIERARALLQGGRAELCLVLAADTYIDSPRLSHLDAAYRLKSMRNVDGFIPGEAAVALLLETAASAERRQVRPLATVGPSGFGTEPVPVEAEGWSTGKGLGDAIGAVISASSGRAPGVWTLCNLNGESYRDREWGLVLARLGDVLVTPETLIHPADKIGEVGAAMGGVLLAYAAHMFSRGHAPAPSALLWTSSDGGSRAALGIGMPR